MKNMSVISNSGRPTKKDNFVRQLKSHEEFQKLMKEKGIVFKKKQFTVADRNGGWPFGGTGEFRPFSGISPREDVVGHTGF